MSDIITHLKSRYDTAMRGGACNDHDYIAKVRPIDLLRACTEIASLRAELDVALKVNSEKVKERRGTFAQLDDAEGRLTQIRQIIDCVENRCAACDGPVTPTLREMTERELRDIYKLADIYDSNGDRRLRGWDE